MLAFSEHEIQETRMKPHRFMSSLVFAAITTGAGVSHAGSAAAPRIESSTIRGNAAASGISAEAAQAAAPSKVKPSRTRNGAATADQSTRIDIGTVEVGAGAAI